ncbi:hypothetical protein MTX78_14900 [Hymenobacter tibetensis]|uniref:Uncharacterized protein n=1 Tax=Hymenobacter tibetensis TaxID=497967 RepID=A0ABY4CTN7_9BACT|nr:hypothetical protein [Hymenobacter tibetensis]UOG73412.1 hypothetical protein MTX78_14900 [Hymenobacter tibetensis]
MPFVRSQSQPSQTLESFYQELLVPDNTWETIQIGNAMLALIERVKQQFVTTPLWGLTSHYHLLLQDQPYYNASDNWGVLVIGNQSGYRIEYCRPKITPLEATVLVRGQASTTTEALAYIAVALIESGGWQSTSEIEHQRAGVQLLASAWQVAPTPL